MRALLLVPLAAASLGACGGGAATGPDKEAAVQPASIDFTTFTKELVRSQSDSAQPVPVSTAQFVFADDDNPDAFASVLPMT